MYDVTVYFIMVIKMNSEKKVYIYVHKYAVPQTSQGLLLTPKQKNRYLGR